MAQKTFEGGCLCGAIRYRATGEPLLVEYCHCGICRRAAGAPVVAWVDFPRSAFALLRGRPAQYASSLGATRGFCPACGSQLTFQWGAEAPKITITVATLDEPEALAPNQHIYTDDQLGWLNIVDDLPRHPAKAPSQERS